MKSVRDLVAASAVAASKARRIASLLPAFIPVKVCRTAGVQWDARPIIQQMT